MNEIQVNHLENLPYETILNIAQGLPVEKIIDLCRTSYKLSRICDDWYFY